MSRKRIKQYLMLLTVVGLIAVAANGSGTFASFTATATNDNNTFATGSLLLKDTVDSVDCLSADGGAGNGTTSGNSATCTTHLNLTNEVPGTAAADSITIQNTGTLAGALTLASTACTPGKIDDTFNTGNLCTDTYMYVQETDGSDANVKCIFGEGAGSTACTAPTTGWANYSASDNIDAFVSSLSSLSSINLTGATTSGGTDGQARKFVFHFYLPHSATDDNVYQDLTAKFPLTWQLTSS